MTKIKSFTTQRLGIQPTSEKDAELIYELMNSPKFIQFVGNRNIHSIEEARAYIRKKMLPQLHSLGYSNYTIVRKEDGKKLGACGLYNREGLDGIDIGFGLLPQYEGKGYAFEASQRILKAAIEDFKIKSIQAITSKEKLGSQALLKKLGFRVSGSITLPGETEELILFTNT